ncbi:hypothetical protein PG999_004939, partial [Apiospora kogelbergensis]
LALVVVALFGGNVLAAADMNACSKGCAVGIFADPSRLGCKAEDKNCACHSGQNLMFGVRDCITQACGLTGAALDDQVAASEKFMNAECVPFTSTAAPATTAPPPAAAPAASPATTAAPAAAPAPTTAPAATTASPAKTDAASPAIKDPPASGQPASSAPSTAAGATSAATSQPTTGASAASADSPSGTSKASSTGSSPAAGVAASTASPTSGKAAGKEEESSPEGLSVAAKAGIGAGAGVVVVMAAITLCCIMMRRRRDSRTASQGPARPARSPMPAISQPVNGRRQYAEDVESPAALNFPFPAVCEKGNNHGLPSPKAAAYKAPASSHDDRYSVKGNRYEEMLPRTQPRTMI